ncbi:MAG: hypothetical protein JO345_06925 [Streptosporangiaceae bacterium]|nr:hypothetical protein [Streptosporangiaceae bacterium]
MTVGFEWRGQPHIARTASVQIREALLPMLMWTSVPVTRRVDQDLTIVDRFILEAALALAPMRAEDVEEVTAIPRDAVLRIVGRLAGLGLLRADGTGFVAVEEQVSAALQQRAVPRYIPAYLTFLYLPDGDDLIAYASGQGQAAPPILHRAEPVSDRAFPSGFGDRPLADFVRDRIRERRIARLADDIVDASPESAVRIPPACPVYRCAGHVRRAGDDVTLVLELKSTTGKKDRCALPGAVGQAALWEAAASRAPEVAQTWEGVVVPAQESATRWRFTLDRLSAGAAVRAGVAVSRPAGLSITVPPACVAEVEVAFSPADTDAAQVFALDHAIREVTDTEHTRLRGDAATLAAARARQEYGLADDAVTTADVEHRLWDDACFRHVYALREPLDFAYD